MSANNLVEVKKVDFKYLNSDKKIFSNLNLDIKGDNIQSLLDQMGLARVPCLACWQVCSMHNLEKY